MILVLNCGSSSLKFCLFDERETPRARGVVERLGQRESTLVCELNGEQVLRYLPAADYRRALCAVVDALSEVVLAADVFFDFRRNPHGLNDSLSAVHYAMSNSF